ncbi:hypothetical protein [Roseomonas sp. CECT 9278]|uniref:hypothetical protein n=1 Tax=Roseomonas sp. CECT 9278 TaxID=2845823 RepID=UPI001E653E9A|nr:hypothetical protein [Roseomonas sp. CECT 9278]CAH0313162.1 hypothetical protein ROS9278_05022 [Roseomonas sp. CECT 9278]
MTEATTGSDLPPRFAVAATPAQAAALLPSLGRVLVGLSAGGATHERIGVVETAVVDGGALRIGGSAHDAVLALEPVARIVADRTGGMRGRVFPRIEFRDGDDRLLMSVTAMDGLEPFDSALAAWVGATEDAPPRPESSGGGELAADDAGAGLLEALRASGGQVEIALAAGPARQAWRGVIEDMKPAMGFANIIRSDFHLHWRGGSLGGLRAAGDAFEALDAEGGATGLTFRPLDAEARKALATAA